ncbi:MAG: YicC family protein [Oscillospiraceae bacterium]|nr:YicC family protein [Oscillospiraceae bacterium]
MIKSMTGFGRHREIVSEIGETGKIASEREIFAEIKSINSRYLDIFVRAPRIYGFLEEKIKQEAAKIISRGKIEIFISVEEKTGSSTQITMNKTYLENYIDILKKIRDEYNLPDDITTMRVSQNRDIYNIEKLEENEEFLWQSVKSVFERAAEGFSGMRLTEGEKLLSDMSERIKKCDASVDEIKVISDNCKAGYFEQFKQRLKDLAGDIVMDENRILTEAAIYADKIEITEEIVRIKSHFSQFFKIVKENAPVGRKLDFLVQEINREINTIGSKSLDVEITNRVIEVKSDIEKIREQIQNIE